jgi:hypothetical protein
MLRLLTTLGTRLRRQDGFTMPLVLATMVVALVVVGAVLSDIQGDFKPGRKDEDRKMAYAAAEAGIQDYLARLDSNPSYWSKCTDPGNNPALGNPGTQNYVNVPGGTSQFAIELLPTSGYSQCVVGNQASFVNAASEFRIRATGRPRAGSTTERSIVATFRPKGFLNYIYFTDYETTDPMLYAYQTDGRSSTSSQGDLITWATKTCGVTRWPLRGSLTWTGRIGSDSTTTVRCQELQFFPGDMNLGPFHTNDSVMVCGTPTFGRRPIDPVEFSGSNPGWRSASGCSGARPKTNALPGYSASYSDAGTWKVAGQLAFPPSNDTLHDDAAPGNRFVGPTFITLNGANMTVTGKVEGGAQLTNATLPIPEGVVYVDDNAAAGSCPGYQPLAPYNGSSSGPPAGNPACGDLFISGTYSQNVTFASKNDIVVTGNVTRTSDAWMLGLIPDKFARIYHPVNRSTCSNAAGTITNVRIDAAILALTHSFTADAYECGASLGTLTVRGAIAQKYRGPVIQGNGSTNSGFVKNYQYDDRLAQRSPPRFMNPLTPAWALAKQTEQIPAS